MPAIKLAVFAPPSPPVSSRVWPAVLVFLFTLTSHLLLPGAVTFLMMLFVLFVLAFWVAHRTPVPEPLLTLLTPITLIILVGSHGFFNYGLYEVGKGAWYVANAGLIMLTGYILANLSNNLTWILRAIVIAGLISAAFHINQFVQTPSLLEYKAEDIRLAAGRGFMISAISVGICIMALRAKLPLFGTHRWLTSLFMAICATSLVLSFSRAWYLSALILVIFLYGLFDQHRWKTSIFWILMAAAAYGAFSFITLNFMDVDKKSLVYEIARIPQEIYVTQYYSLADINANWRGYETARAISTYSSGNALELIFGQGFGTTVNLGLLMNLGAEYSTREAPVLHNGYAQLLVNTGPVGIVIYLFIIWRIIQRGYQYTLLGNNESLFVGRFLMALGVIFLLTTLTIGGMLNKSSLYIGMLMIGALFGYHPINSHLKAES